MKNVNFQHRSKKSTANSVEFLLQFYISSIWFVYHINHFKKILLIGDMSLSLLTVKTER